MPKVINSDLILIIGTSLLVSPFNLIPVAAKTKENMVVLMNMEHLDGWGDNNR